MNVDLFKHIAEIAPGFIAVAVHNFYAGDLHDKQNKFVEFERYFVYSGTVWIMTEILIKYHYINDTAKLMYSLGTAVILGLIWPAIIKDVLFKALNCYRRGVGINEVVDEKNLLAMVTNDGKPHYLLVYKHNNLIAEGWYDYIMDSENSLSLRYDEEWKRYFVDNPHGERTLIYMDKDVYIREYFEIRG